MLSSWAMCQLSHSIKGMGLFNDTILMSYFFDYFQVMRAVILLFFSNRRDAQNMEEQSSLDAKVMIKGYVLALIAILVWTGFILISRAGALASLSLPDMMIVSLLASMFAVPLFGEQITVGLIIALVCISVGTIVGNVLPIKRPLLKI
jgi:hypothetical protein